MLMIKQAIQSQQLYRFMKRVEMHIAVFTLCFLVYKVINKTTKNTTDVYESKQSYRKIEILLVNAPSQSAKGL